MGERIREREGYRKEVFKWGTGNRCRTSYLTHTNTHTHEYKAQWGLKCGPAPLISLLLSSWHLVSFTPSPHLLNITLCLWFCLNLFRMHLDISTPGRIGEIEGVRMRESHKNREWLSERSHWGIERDDRRTKVERKPRDKLKRRYKSSFTHLHSNG